MRNSEFSGTELDIIVRTSKISIRKVDIVRNSEFSVSDVANNVRHLDFLTIEVEFRANKTMHAK